MCEGASKQFSDPKNSTTPGPRSTPPLPRFEIPGSATATLRISCLIVVCDHYVHIPQREKKMLSSISQEPKVWNFYIKFIVWKKEVEKLSAKARPLPSSYFVIAFLEPVCAFLHFTPQRNVLFCRDLFCHIAILTLPRMRVWFYQKSVSM